jgi:Mor family transcriptional regulator
MKEIFILECKMSYKKAEYILPAELLELVQKDIAGECIYIPRKSENRKEWGSKTSIREESGLQDTPIYKDYQFGYDYRYLSETYFLSVKSIQRIIRQKK